MNAEDDFPTPTTHRSGLQRHNLAKFPSHSLQAIYFDQRQFMALNGLAIEG